MSDDPEPVFRAMPNSYYGSLWIKAGVPYSPVELPWLTFPRWALVATRGLGATIIDRALRVMARSEEHRLAILAVISVCHDGGFHAICPADAPVSAYLDALESPPRSYLGSSLPPPR